MYEKTYGTKYAATKDLSRVEIAKLIRADIKAAVKDGSLPRGKYAVTTESFSGGGSINLTIREMDVPTIFNAEHLALEASDPHYRYPRGERYSEIVIEALETLKDIHNAYNYDGSDIMSDYFDVRFYGDVKFHWEYESDCRMREMRALTTVKPEPTPARHLTLVRSTPAPAVSEHEAFLAALGAL